MGIKWVAAAETELGGVDIVLEQRQWASRHPHLARATETKFTCAKQPLASDIEHIFCTHTAAGREGATERCGVTSARARQIAANLMSHACPYQV